VSYERGTPGEEARRTRERECVRGRARVWGESVWQRARVCESEGEGVCVRERESERGCVRGRARCV